MQRNNSGGSSSSRPTDWANLQRSATDDVTWLEFLRTAGGTVPADSDRSTSADRKRRHTGGSSPERRGYPYPHYNTSYTGRMPPVMAGSSAAPAGSSRATAIDLTASPAARPHQQPGPIRRVSAGTESIRGRMQENGRSTTGASVRGNPFSRADSDIVLPKWQPDGEADRCPVCQTEFSFWYRKHHCRKCGRVVCNACSPHRITIPRQYIVQPPVSLDDGTTSPASHGYSGHLGGGEIVRVCNPCVPDPWMPGAAPNTPQRPTGEDARRREHQAMAPPHPSVFGFATPPQPPLDGNGRARARSHQSNNSFVGRGAGFGSASVPSWMYAPQQHNTPPHAPPTSRPHPHRPSNSSSAVPSPPFHSHPSTTPPVPPPPRRAPAPPPREVREEDECPVCGTELPPGDSIREEHIRDCINTRFSSTPSQSAFQMQQPPPPPPRTSSVPSTTSAPASVAAAHARTASSSNPSEPTSARPRATSYRPRGMAVYIATEKDCMSAEGEPQECVICFEEFQPGDDMGRMECLCKFHRVCIRNWWEVKGAGCCPTHQLHE